MPLYDFSCKACGHLATYLLKHGVQAVCAACGSGDTEKRIAPFVGRVEGGGGHVHGPGCGHDADRGGGGAHGRTQSDAPKAPPLAAAGGCATTGCHGPTPAGGCGNSYTDAVVKKYLP